MKSIYSNLAEAAMGVLVACLALYLSVKLVEEILPQLLIGAAIAFVVYLAVVIAKYRRSNW